MATIINVAKERFKVKNDVIDAYKEVTKVLGECEDCLLAIILAMYRTRRRRKYMEKVVKGLINEVTRTLLLSFTRFYITYRKVEPKARVKVAKMLRAALDTLF